MNKTSINDAFASRFKQIQEERAGLSQDARIIEPKQQSIIIKPATKSWEKLLVALKPVLDKKGLYRECILITIKARYDAGHGAELETAAELALELGDNPIHYFAASVSQKKGNWETKTLKTVHETWEVRRNTMEVMRRLELESKSLKAIFALCWRLKGTVMRFLGIATEQGVGVKNPTALFFWLTKELKPSTA